MRDAPLQPLPPVIELLPEPPLTVAAASHVSNRAPNSYGEILTSSALIGSSTLITVLASIVRTKLVAVFLGPGGLGLMGVFTSLTSMVGTATGMGITTSGVRQVAEAVSSGETVKIARAVTAVRLLRWRLGLLGAVLLAAFCVPVSRLTFGNTDHAIAIAVLSLVVLGSAVSEGQVALLQGFRRMREVAKVAVLGTTLSTALTLPILYFWRPQAVVALLLLASGAGLAASWWYARRLSVERKAIEWRDALDDIRVLLRLGLASMSAGLMVAAIAYAVRVVLVRELGFEAVGMYQSATALSAVYCGFILSAMGADFLPRLSAVATDDGECNRLVNEQAEVGLLLAFPGICATLAFAPAIIQLLYSGEFGFASEVLRWQVLGVFLRVASWPLGYLLLAKGKAGLYFWTEFSYNALHAGLIWICVQLWGLLGTGVAFFGLYVYYSLLMSLVTRQLTGFEWSMRNRRFASIAIPTVVVVFACPLVLPSPWHVIAAGVTTALAVLYSVRALLSLAGHHGIQQSLRGIRDLVRGVDATVER